jgi:DNA-binding SARP family transcriptional activator
MWFGILGAVEVADDDGQPLPIAQARVRGLLWLLALWANRPVSPAELAEALWIDPPPGFPGALRTHVWALRRQLGPAGGLTGRLHKDAAGYRLDVRPGELDLEAFRALADEGRRAFYGGDARGAEAVLDRALRIWRDPGLVDLPGATAAEMLGSRLLDERRMVAEHLVDARMALGRYSEVLGELRETLAAEPLNERSWQQMMLALYCCGRRAEALEAYRWAHGLLANDHGIDPGPGLRRLHERILSDDPSLGSLLDAELT